MFSLTLSLLWNPLVSIRNTRKTQKLGHWALDSGKTFLNYLVSIDSRLNEINYDISLNPVRWLFLVAEFGSKTKKTARLFSSFALRQKILKNPTGFSRRWEKLFKFFKICSNHNWKGFSIIYHSRRPIILWYLILHGKQIAKKAKTNPNKKLIRLFNGRNKKKTIRSNRIIKKSWKTKFCNLESKPTKYMQTKNKPPTFF